MAKRMNTSRSQVDPMLDPANVAMSLDTLSRAASAIEREITLEMV